MASRRRSEFKPLKYPRTFKKWHLMGGNDVTLVNDKTQVILINHNSLKEMRLIVEDLIYLCDCYPEVCRVATDPILQISITYPQAHLTLRTENLVEVMALLENLRLAGYKTADEVIAVEA